MAALPGLMQVEPLQAPAPLLGALGARPAPVVLPEDTGGPAGVTDPSCHRSCHPSQHLLHAPTMRPGPSSAHGMDATRHMNPCQLWEALWLTSSAPIKLPKPGIPKAVIAKRYTYTWRFCLRAPGPHPASAPQALHPKNLKPSNPKTQKILCQLMASCKPKRVAQARDLHRCNQCNHTHILSTFGH